MVQVMVLMFNVLAANNSYVVNNNYYLMYLW